MTAKNYSTLDYTVTVVFDGPPSRECCQQLMDCGLGDLPLTGVPPRFAVGTDDRGAIRFYCDDVYAFAHTFSDLAAQHALVIPIMQTASRGMRRLAGNDFWVTYRRFGVRVASPDDIGHPCILHRVLWIRHDANDSHPAASGSTLLKTLPGDQLPPGTGRAFWILSSTVSAKHLPPICELQRRWSNAGCDRIAILPPVPLSPSGSSFSPESMIARKDLKHAVARLIRHDARINPVRNAASHAVNARRLRTARFLRDDSVDSTAGVSAALVSWSLSDLPMIAPLLESGASLQVVGGIAETPSKLLLNVPTASADADWLHDGDRAMPPDCCLRTQLAATVVADIRSRGIDLVFTALNPASPKQSQHATTAASPGIGSWAGPPTGSYQRIAALAACLQTDAGKNALIDASIAGIVCGGTDHVAAEQIFLNKFAPYRGDRALDSTPVTAWCDAIRRLLLPSTFATHFPVLGEDPPYPAQQKSSGRIVVCGKSERRRANEVVLLLPLGCSVDTGDSARIGHAWIGHSRFSDQHDFGDQSMNAITTNALSLQDETPITAESMQGWEEIIHRGPWHSFGEVAGVTYLNRANSVSVRIASTNNDVITSAVSELLIGNCSGFTPKGRFVWIGSDMLSVALPGNEDEFELAIEVNPPIPPGESTAGKYRLIVTASGRPEAKCEDALDLGSIKVQPGGDFKWVRWPRVITFAALPPFDDQWKAWVSDLYEALRVAVEALPLEPQSRAEIVFCHNLAMLAMDWHERPIPFLARALARLAEFRHNAGQLVFGGSSRVDLKLSNDPLQWPNNLAKLLQELGPTTANPCRPLRTTGIGDDKEVHFEQLGQTLRVNLRINPPDGHDLQLRIPGSVSKIYYEFQRGRPIEATGSPMAGHFAYRLQGIARACTIQVWPVPPCKSSDVSLWLVSPKAKQPKNVRATEANLLPNHHDPI